MLIASSELRGFAIQARDGEVATVGDLLFDDATWQVRWIVAKAGTWLTERKLLLHPSAVRGVDHDRHVLVAGLTKAQLEAGPPLFEHAPVSRHMEARLSNYYGSDRLWGDGSCGAGVLARPLSMGSQFAPEDAFASDRCPLREGDPHLRGVIEVEGYRIHAVDGAIGHVENLPVDDATWEVRFLVVDTRDWWSGKHVLVPRGTVRNIDQTQGRVSLSLTRAQIGSAPAWDRVDSDDEPHDGQMPGRDGWVGFGP